MEWKSISCHTFNRIKITPLHFCRAHVITTTAVRIQATTLAHLPCTCVYFLPCLFSLSLSSLRVFILAPTERASQGLSGSVLGPGCVEGQGKPTVLSPRGVDSARSVLFFWDTSSRPPGSHMHSGTRELGCTSRDPPGGNRVWEGKNRWGRVRRAHFVVVLLSGRFHPDSGSLRLSLLFRWVFVFVRFWFFSFFSSLSSYKPNDNLAHFLPSQNPGPST